MATEHKDGMSAEYEMLVKAVELSQVQLTEMASEWKQQGRPLDWVREAQAACYAALEAVKANAAG